MNDTQREHQIHRELDSNAAQKERRPYWKRAHQDWRFWLALILMIVAMGIYVMTEDLSIRPQPPVSGSLRK
jgi:hypothetical protein